MENKCDNLLQIMKELFYQIQGLKMSKSRIFDNKKKIEIDKINAMHIKNYLKCFEVYSKFCNEDK